MSKICADEEGCDRPSRADGLCGKHYQRKRKTTAEPCSIAGCGRGTVAQGYCTKHYGRWKRHGDPVYLKPVFRGGARRYTLDETYFDVVNDEHRAYWLGFIAADGGVIRGPRTNSLRVELAAKDEGHLLAIRAELGSNRPLQRHRTCLMVQFDSAHLLDALAQLGIGPRKSATVEAWPGPAELMPHYWRGVFDGDGSIYRVSTRKDWCLNLVGSRPMIEAFVEWSQPISGGTATPRYVNGAWVCAVTGFGAPQRLATALYGKADIALPRKLALARELMSISQAQRDASDGRRRPRTN